MLNFRPSPLFLIVALSLIASPLYAAEYVPWSVENYSINNSLSGSAGDPERGRNLVSMKSKGNCLACHQIPINDVAFHGTIGPELTGVGRRLSAAQLRLRIADEKQINPNSIMPGYHVDPARLNRVVERYQGQTILSAQEVEDIVAYLVTLK